MIYVEAINIVIGGVIFLLLIKNIRIKNLLSTPTSFYTNLQQKKKKLTYLILSPSSFIGTIIQWVDMLCLVVFVQV